MAVSSSTWRFQFAGRRVLASYPLIPWLAVMAIGFCFGQILLFGADRRRTLVLRTGSLLIAAFLILRTLNIYGDSSPHGVGILSFINCTKYPALLDFLLVTLGPGLIAWWLSDRLTFLQPNPLIVFGRAPFFYFVVRFFVIHALLVLMCWDRYGNAALSFIFNPVPSFGGLAPVFPPDFGFRLSTVYLVWIVVLGLLYSLCVWFGKVKSRSNHWWLRYL